MQILPDFWHLVEGVKNFDKNPKKTAFSTPTTWGGKNIMEILKIFRQLISEGVKKFAVFEKNFPTD